MRGFPRHQVFVASQTSSNHDALVVSTVDPASTPAFLTEPQVATDVLTGVNFSAYGITTDTIRYQGEWKSNKIYLGVSSTSNVWIITLWPGDKHHVSFGGSTGNVAIGSGTTDGLTLQYIPPGTSGTLPHGWRALSTNVIVHA